LQRAAIETARALLVNSLALMPHKKALWRKAIDLERELGSVESLKELLKRGIEHK
jgi:hypothetical protein